MRTPRSGFATAITGNPSSSSSPTTPAQLEDSANAPCTSTTVGRFGEGFVMLMAAPCADAGPGNAPSFPADTAGVEHATPPFAWGPA